MARTLVPSVRFNLKQLVAFRKAVGLTIANPIVQGKVNRGAITAATRVLKNGFDSIISKNIPRKEPGLGALGRATASKVVTYKNTGISVGIIGIRTNRTESSGFKRTKTGTVQPSKYWHLVEQGTDPHDHPVKRIITMVNGVSRFTYIRPPGGWVHPGAKPHNIIPQTINRYGAIAQQKAILTWIKLFEKQVKKGQRVIKAG